MSGHSKWASIKHKKAITDARRGQAYTKLANLITLASKQGGGDPEMNFRLRLAVAKAKAANMPTANIERAIKKGLGEGGGAAVEEIMYEGYGPGGVAIMVEVATDNRNRTAAEVRSAFSKHGGRMGESGSVAYQFAQRGVIVLKADDPDGVALAAIEAGVEDVEQDSSSVTVYTVPAQLDQVRSQLSQAGLEVESAELSWIPKTSISVPDPKTAQTVMRLMDALDDLDDVTGIAANFDIPEEVVGQIDG